MNNVVLIGRLTKDPETRWNGDKAVCSFTLAIDRPYEKDKADFLRVVCFGKTAENCEKFLGKGRLAGVAGRIQTGSYQDKNGETRYTTDIIADRVEFLDRGEKKPVEGFAALEDDEEDCPF